MNTTPTSVRELTHVTFVNNVMDLNSTASGYEWQAVASPTEGTADHPVRLGYGKWDRCLTATEATHAVLDLTVWSDYSGSTVERSNCRSLLRDFPGTFIHLYGAYGTEGLMLPVVKPDDWRGRDFDYGAEAWQSLLDDLASLSDYPLYDDDDFAELENDLAHEAWDSYLKYDTMSALRAAGVPDQALEGETVIRERFYDLTYDADYGPEAESAVSVHFPFFDKTVATIAAELLSSVQLTPTYGRTPTMTRKHFQAIADVIANRLSYAETDAVRDEIRATARELASMCRRFNAGFNRDRFLRACGIES